MRKAITVCLVLLLHFASSAQDSPRTLRESLSTAMRFNPNTRSTDEFLESVAFATRAVRASRLPEGSISCSLTRFDSTSRVDEAFSRSESRSRRCGISFSVNIYDGGAAYYRYLSALASEESTRASYNTADSLIPNTRGQLARTALEAYLDLVQTRDRINFLQWALATLNEFQVLGPSENLNTLIVNTQQTLQRQRDVLELSRQRFQFIVRVPASPDIESIDSAIASLAIPAQADSAIELALRDGPEVKRRDADVTIAKNDLLARRASLGPTISAQASWGRGLNQEFIDPMTSFNAQRSIGVTLSVPIARSRVYQEQSAAKNLSSATSRREAAIEEAKFSIGRLYSNLSSRRRSYEAAQSSYADQFSSLQVIVERLKNRDTNGLVLADLLVSIGNLSSQQMQVQGLQYEIIFNQFSVQQVTGLLFSENL